MSVLANKVEVFELGEDLGLVKILSNCEWDTLPTHAVVDKSLMKKCVEIFTKTVDGVGEQSIAASSVTFDCDPSLFFLVVAEPQGIDNKDGEHVLIDGVIYSKYDCMNELGEGRWQPDGLECYKHGVHGRWCSKHTDEKAWFHLSPRTLLAPS